MPTDVRGEIARTTTPGTTREVVAMGRWTPAHREWAAQIRVEARSA